jgi:hypothetical protein
MAFEGVEWENAVTRTFFVGGTEMADRKDVKAIVLLTEELYGKLKSTESQRLTKEEVLAFLGGSSPYYSHVVTALAQIKKITKKSGRAGGIELRTGKGIQQEILEGNRKQLQRYFSSLSIDFAASKPKENKKLERDLYEPLKAYLEESGQYELVENRAQFRVGHKWENVDLVAVAFSSLSYHAGIFPKLTGIEVKTKFPGITDIQQAASYLRYCQSSYLCFFDREYNGKNFEALMTRLRDEGIWDAVSTFSVGLIVAFWPTKRAREYRFHIIREAPDEALDPNVVEQGIDLLLAEASKNELTVALRKQIVRLMHDVKDLR